MDHKIQLDLIISGFDCDPKEISPLLNIIPSMTGKKGDQIQNTTLIRNHNVWELSSGLPQKDDFDNHFNSIIEKVRDSIALFKSLPNSSEVNLSCAIWFREDSEYSLPSVHLDNNQIQFLTSINAEIDFDYYLVPK